MEIFFSTVIRSAPIQAGGELIRLDWGSKRILQRTPIYPTDPALDDPNPRGSTRGGRGIELLDGHIVVANYHTLQFYDADLRLQRSVTHPLMVNLHEIHAVSPQRMWVAATAIDAALAYDLTSGALLDVFWPREMASFQAAFELYPLEIDKTADNRARFLEDEPHRDRGHLHLNAVATWEGDLYALFCKFGAVVNLTQGRVVVQDLAFKGGHNLRFLADGTLVVNGTFSRTVRFYDVATGRLKQAIDLLAFPWARWLTRWQRPRYALQHYLYRLGLQPKPNWPLFVRGLEVTDDHLFVGVSPASIMQIDWRKNQLIDAFNYSSDVRACVHGLRVSL